MFEDSMTESEFLKRAESALQAVELAVERALPDVDLQRVGPVLTLEFDDGSKIIVNSHAAAQEIWVASRSGGQHFRMHQDQWVDTRDGTELFAVLSKLASDHAGETVVLVKT